MYALTKKRGVLIYYVANLDLQKNSSLRTTYADNVRGRILGYHSSEQLPLHIGRSAA